MGLFIFTTTILLIGYGCEGGGEMEIVTSDIQSEKNLQEKDEIASEISDFLNKSSLDEVTKDDFLQKTISLSDKDRETLGYFLTSDVETADSIFAAVVEFVQKRLQGDITSEHFL